MIRPVFRAILKKESRCFLDAYRLVENVRDQLLEGAKELHVVGTFGVASPDPRSVDQTGKQMPIEQRLHILLKLLAKLTPIALVLGMDKQRRKEIDVLDVHPTAVTGEHIATTVLEWQLGPDKTILAVAGPLPPLEAAVEISSRVVDDEALTPTLQCNRVSFCGSAVVQNRRQIFKFASIGHGAPSVSTTPRDYFRGITNPFAHPRALSGG
jgi:hypothetical protein